MEIKDLRIGNYYIGYDDKLKQVDLGVFYLLFNDVDLDEIIKSPVLLTETWLVNLGFEKDGSMYRKYPFHIFLAGHPDQGHGIGIAGKGILENVLFVHEIQDFCYTFGWDLVLSNISDTNTIS